MGEIGIVGKIADYHRGECTATIRTLNIRTRISRLFPTGESAMSGRKTFCASVVIVALLLFGAAALAGAAGQAKIAEPNSTPAGPAARTVAKLDFDSPGRGERSPITGKLTGVEKPADYKLLILVSNDRKRW